MTGNIQQASRDHSWQLAEVVASGFQLLPVSTWLVEDVSRRLGIMSRYFAILVDHAFEHGHVDQLNDFTAVAVWLHNQHGPTPTPPEYESRVREACGEYADRFLRLDQLLDEHHPTGVGHHHLALLSVLPQWQNRGRGTALLRHHLRRLDADGIPAYLEASSEGSRDLYRRHGFAVRQPFAVSDKGVFWPMWLRPGGAVFPDGGERPPISRPS